MLMGTSAGTAHADDRRVVPVETVEGGFAGRTSFTFSEALFKDDRRIDAGLGDMLSAADGRFTYDKKVIGPHPQLESGHYRYRFSVASQHPVPAWLMCTINDRNSGAVLSRARAENSRSVSCEYDVP